ncbi:hypothetical protein B0H16DRAFT_1564512 [Mycena metata]|uniref:Uncharacterized protein n=1 Tax=Mycena metata TaxID=1033252 RepID=A0AAD7N1M5_9AGAR|nr:hypothetical protein B0H16DRAFT_1564836 [Mycena metata]KAJ7741811.1 hypothetical protein B0H16DRAFT_1564512 [Mycena metata]
MTEYDYSPGAQAKFQRTQQRISNWADDTAQCAPQYKSPFVPRSDVPSNTFYRSSSRSPAHTPSPPPRSHGSPSPSHSHGRPSTHRTHSHSSQHVRSPLRSQTIDVVSPNDSISQVSGPSHRSSQRPSHRSGPSYRSRSHSPTRYRDRSHHRSAPAYTVQYVQPPQQMAGYGQPQQPAAYVVYPRDRRVQVVYPQPVGYPPAAYPTQTQNSGGLLHRIFGSQSGHGRSRSLSTRR